MPADMDNLALRAADLVRLGRGTTITLTKNLPAASGIGGGSADAAASVRAALMLEDDAGSEILALGPEILVDTRLRPLLGAWCRHSHVPSACPAARPGDR